MSGTFTRRQFLASSTLSAAAAGLKAGAAPAAPRPNILLILTDQQHLETVSALGAAGVSTPGMDRLAATGTFLTESYCTGALCSPSRSSIFTGRMPCETGVYCNELPIRDDIPNIGKILRAAGYDTYFAGKWHLPSAYSWNIDGFEVLTTGITGQGHYCDSMVTRACDALLSSRKPDDPPFFLFAGYLQPHDICEFGTLREGFQDDRQFPDIEPEFIPLPPNFHSAPAAEDATLTNMRKKTAGWSDRLWQYYNWGYSRMVEQVDAEIGRLLDTLESAGLDKNTLVVFTSDHGEGRGRHGLTTKNYLYEEAIKVPMIVSFPGRIAPGRKDSAHLTSGADILPTICDYAGVAPPRTCGLSLRPVLESSDGPVHDAVVTEARLVGRAVRTADFKYIDYFGTDAVQLFNLRSDPWEMNNLAGDSRHRAVLRQHMDILQHWEAGLDPAPEARVPWHVPREEAKKIVAMLRVDLKGTVFNDIQTNGISWSGYDPDAPRFTIDRRILPLDFSISFTPGRDGRIKLFIPVYRGQVTITDIQIEGGENSAEFSSMNGLPPQPWVFDSGAEWIDAADRRGIRLRPGQKLWCGSLSRVQKNRPVTIRIKMA
jgi:choline-sulfatase